MLQVKQSELQEEFSKSIEPDKNLIEQIASMGFDNELIKSVLKVTSNDMEKAIEKLLQMKSDGSYENVLTQMINNLPLNPSMPSTSGVCNQIRDKINEQVEEAEVSVFCSGFSIQSNIKSFLFSGIRTIFGRFAK